MSTAAEAPPAWAQELIGRFDKLENTVNNCVMTRLDSINGRLDGMKQDITAMKGDIAAMKDDYSTLAESYDFVQEMKTKIDDIHDRLP